MTPLEQFGLVFLKREDKNITGSAKDRAIDLQTNQKMTHAVISSTGNAAISAQYFCHLKNIQLTTFISPKTSLQKIKLIDNPIVTDKPISESFKFSKKNHSYLLRQSTDPIALLGYQKIGQEIIVQCPLITSLFIAVGSGTTLLGISQALPKSVKIFAVQPASHCPIASHFDKDFQPESMTITDALNTKLLPLKQKVIDACFSGVVVQNKDILPTIDTSAEGNLAYAGYLKAKTRHQLGNYPVIVLTGTQR
ncbi:MAG: PLP-dependent lyase/thiolase [Microgenomates group bacterium]